MKYKLSQKQLDEAMEELKKIRHIGPHGASVNDWHPIPFNLDEMEPIAEALPKPTIRNVEDLKALSEWEYLYFKDGIPWSCRSYEPETLNLLIRKEATIRQISLPSNSFLLSECIEPEIEEVEVGDLIYYGYSVGGKDFDGYILVHSIDVDGYKSEPNEAGGYNYLNFDHCKLIRKAKDITIEDRVKYLGEKDPRYTPKKSVGAIMEDDFPLANEARVIVPVFSDAQLEQISQIIDDKLKEREC